MSGSTNVPRSSKIWSASGHTGWLAASMIIGALMRGAFSCRDHAAQRGGNQQLDVELQQLFVRDPLGIAIALSEPWCSRRVLQDLGNVEPAGPVVAAAHVADGHELEFGLVQELGGVRADVAKTLQSDARVCAGLRPRRLSNLKAKCPTPRPVASSRPGIPYSSTGLPVTHAGAEAVVLLILVHDPGHDFANSCPCRGPEYRCPGRSRRGFRR